MVTTQDRPVAAWRRPGQRQRQGRRAAARRVVFLHGAFGLQWDPFLDALASRTPSTPRSIPARRPARPTRSSRSTHSGTSSSTTTSSSTSSASSRPRIIGHSFGGMVAAEIAATNPDRVSKLVLIDPIGLWRDDHPVRNWMATPFGDLPKYLFADQNNPMAQMIAAASRITEMSDEQLDVQIQIMWSLACTGKFVWPIPDRGLHKRLHRITAPTLVIWGKQDGIISPEYADEFASRIASARVELIDNAGHLPQFEQLGGVSKLVDDFLNG